MKIGIRYQDGITRTFDVREGYNYLTGSLGVVIYDNQDDTYTARFGNGYVGREDAGGLFFARIWVEPGFEHPEIYPRIGHYSESGDGPERIGFGTETDYFLPGGVKILRYSKKGALSNIYNKRLNGSDTYKNCLARPRALYNQESVRHNAMASAMRSALQTGIPNESLRLLSLCGPWMPMGYPVPNAAGGEGINPFPGWEFSSSYHLLAHDLTMERMPIDYRDAFTGEPKTRANQPVYRSTRGWGAWTQHAEFVKRDENDPNPDARIPRDVNEGACPYRNRLLSYLAHDDQHLVRATANAKASAMMWRDQCAADDLAMIAADAYMGLPPYTLFDNRENNGSGVAGRGLAWTLDALNAAQVVQGFESREWHTLIAEIASFCVRAQMQNGAFYRATAKDENTLGFSPSPWSGLGMPMALDVAQTMETCYLAGALAQDYAYKNDAHEAFNGMILSPMLKWMSVGVMGQDASAMYEEGVGVNETYWLWPLAGILGRTREMPYMILPGGKVRAGPYVARALMGAGNYNASAKALEALEK